MSEDGDFDDDGWRPPTEAELKVIEARRERSDKISKIMGQYLLKGHKMLDQTCPRCTCILLQLKGTSDLHCVSCIDLDSESKKDDPALNLAAASATVNEGNLRGYHEASSSSSSSESSSASAVRRTQPRQQQQPSQSSPTRTNAPPARGKLQLHSQQQLLHESVEEHSGSCIMPLESLTRSQLTAVHDIPASEAVTPPQVCVAAQTTATTSCNQSSSNSRLHCCPVTSSADRAEQQQVLMGARTTLSQTIEVLSQGLNDVNGELLKCPPTNNSCPSSQLNWLLELVTKYGDSLAAVLHAYNNIAST